MSTITILVWNFADELGVSVPEIPFLEDNTIIIPDCELDLPAPTSTCTLKVGIINSYSSGSECFSGGTEHKRGYELALEELNSQVSETQCQIELIQTDDRRNNATAGQLVQELVNDGALLIIGAYSSGATIVAAEEADRLGIPLIVPSASSELITAVGHDWVFRINATSADYVSQAMAYTATLSELPTVAVIYENSVFGESAAVAVTSQAEELGISVVGYTSYQPSTNTYKITSADLQGPLTTIGSANPDVIYLVSNSIPDATVLLQTSKALEITPKLFIANAGAFVSPDLLERIDEEAENVVVTAQWSADVSWISEDGLDAEAFVRRFRQKYAGDMPGMRSVQTHTSLSIASDVIKQAQGRADCEKDDLTEFRECIRDQLRAYTQEQTLFGNIDFNDTTGQNQHTVLLVQIVPDGAGYRFATIYPEKFKTQEAVIYNEGEAPQ